MTRKHLWLLLAATLPLGACGDDRITPLWIQSFGVEKTEIPVGQSINKNVVLSEKATARTYIEIKNSDYKDFLEVRYGTAKNDSIVIKYEPGQDSHTIQLVGLKSSAGKKLKVRFQIRDSKSGFQDLEVVVKDLQNVDAGPSIDYGALPDLGKPDSGPPPNEAGAADKGAADQGATKEASTPADKGATVDSAATKG